MLAAIAWIFSCSGVPPVPGQDAPPQADTDTARSTPTAASMTLLLMAPLLPSADLQPTVWVLARPEQGRMTWTGGTNRPPGRSRNWSRCAAPGEA
jgi:hypothetical protein